MKYLQNEVQKETLTLDGVWVVSPEPRPKTLNPKPNYSIVWESECRTPKHCAVTLNPNLNRFEISGCRGDFRVF